MPAPELRTRSTCSTARKGDREFPKLSTGRGGVGSRNVLTVPRSLTAAAAAQQKRLTRRELDTLRRQIRFFGVKVPHTTFEDFLTVLMQQHGVAVKESRAI